MPVMPIGSPDPQPTLRVYVSLLVDQIEAIARALRDVEALYERAVEAGAPEADALVRRADAFDAAAVHILSPSFAIPDDLAERVRAASPEVQAEIHATIVARIREEIARHSHALHCAAAQRYRDALALAPDHPRAADQRARYGAAFLESCDRDAAR